MKIMIEVGNQYLGIEAGEKVGAILEALRDARKYSRDYAGAGEYSFKPTCLDGKEESINISIINESALKPMTPLMDELTASLKASDNRWMEYYNRAAKAEAELKELKAKVSGLSEESRRG
jgi:hypothetical protein